MLGSQVVGISQDNVQISGTRGMSSGFRKTFFKAAFRITSPMYWYVRGLVGDEDASGI